MTIAETTALTARPGFEGANIRTWVGFKHFMYLAEAAVLEWFRERDLGPQRLYRDFGLTFEIVDSAVQLPAVVEVDDVVTVTASHRARGAFDVRMINGDGRLTLRGKVQVRLVPDAEATAGVSELPPAALDEFVGPVSAPGEHATVTIPAAAFTWSWRARYFHCHFSDRVQHSAYVRALEEVVDRYLEDRGISVPSLLHGRGWIPVVSRARVTLIAPAHMDETIHTTFEVDDVIRGTAYDGQMICAVRREEGTVPVASGRILHGYAVTRGPATGSLASFDEEVTAALLGTRR